MNGLMRRYFIWKVKGMDNQISSLKSYIEDCSAYSSYAPEEENAGILEEIGRLEQQRNNIRSKLQLKLTK